MEEQTKGGTPSGESTTGGAPSEEGILDKLPIRTDWAKASVGSELSVESSESPSKELSKEGNWTGGKNPYERANGNFGGTTGEGTKSREGTKGCGCSKLTLREQSHRVTPSDGTENSGKPE